MVSRPHKKNLGSGWGHPKIPGAKTQISLFHSRSHKFDKIDIINPSVKSKTKFYCCLNACNKSEYILNTVEYIDMSEARKQLEVFHDPFSNATSQPKIPDGKTTESLGLSLQSVGEIVNEEDGNPIQGDASTMHLLFFPGQNGCLFASNVDDTGGVGAFNTYGFDDAGGPDWLNMGISGGTVSQYTPYAQWRTVSAGLRLSLLNSVEEDDGWFEAVRLNEPLSPDDFYLSTKGRQTLSGTDVGICHPAYPITQVGFATRVLSNEPSYVTGLLRDLENFQFELHGKMDHHDFVQGKENIYIGADSIGASNPVLSPYQAEFNSDGHDDVYDMVNQYIDPGYDMIYIRLHCRENVSGSVLNGSRIHYNFVSNQEVTYRGDQRDSRYQTQSQNIGLAAAARHGTLRRMRGQSAIEMK